MASALAIGMGASAAMAQQTSEGTVTTINRLSGTVAIRQTQNGTVGASSAAAEEFKVQDASLLEPLHAGDRVSFSVSEGGGRKTITRLQRQKD